MSDTQSFGQINIVLSNIPGLLRDIIVNAIASETDITIVAEAHSTGELERYLEAYPTDIVVAADRNPEFAADTQRLLESCVRPKFLVVAESGGASFLHRMKPETLPLGQLTPEGLVREIRNAARSDPG